jgi:hypothetical protein
MSAPFLNPFKPGAGHPPPYLAGREDEKREFLSLLEQQTVMTNLVLTGLRGVGKTVLLDTLKPLAIESGWLWAGTDLSESSSVSEDSIAIRMLADISPLVAGYIVGESETKRMGFIATAERKEIRLDFRLLKHLYDETPGLSSDKLKAVIELMWSCLKDSGCRGIILAYDEAQNLGDQADQHQYPLSLLLDVFQSIQKKGLPVMLVFTGLPTLFPKLVDARTFAERMFRVVTLEQLDEKDSRDAIVVPIEKQACPIRFTEAGIEEIIRHSGGYPYFIQFLCREMFDSYLQQKAGGQVNPVVTVAQAVKKLDTDFFAGRWNRVTDRQRALLSVIAELPTSNDEFTVQEVVEKSRERLKKPFSPSHVTHMLATLSDNGLVYKNRHGRYCFAVPLLGQFIRRQESERSKPQGEFEF